MKSLLPAAALLVLGARFAAAEDAAIDLRIKLLKGASWKVEQSVEMTGSEAPPVENTESPLVQHTWTIAESWTDLCDGDREGSPAILKRTWVSSKMGRPDFPQEDCSLTGASITLEQPLKETTSTVTVLKGKPVDATLAALGKGPPEAVVLLLPAAPVKPGEEWTVPAAAVCRFQRVVTSSAGGAPRVRMADFPKLVENLKADGEIGHGCDLAGKVTAVEKGEATIEFQGTKTDTGRTDITATLKWNVTRGRPVSLEWNQKRTVKANDELRTKGFTETWLLKRTWK